MSAEQGMPSGLVSLEVASTSLAELNKDGTPDLLVKGVHIQRRHDHAAIEAV